MSITITIRVDESVKERLEKLAVATHRSKSFLAAEAVKDFLDLNEWQVDEISRSIDEANGEDFASDSDVKALRGKWS